MADERWAYADRAGDADRFPPDHPELSEAGVDLKRSLYDAAEEVGRTLADAQRFAGELRAHARAEADCYLRDRRREADLFLEDRVEGFASLDESVQGRLDRLRTRLHEVAEDVDHLARAIDEVARPAGSPEVAKGSRAIEPVDREQPPIAVAYPGSGATRGPCPTGAGALVAGRGEATDLECDTGLVMRAAQMAIAGASEDEVRRRLSSEYAEAEAELALSTIFGRR